MSELSIAEKVVFQKASIRANPNGRYTLTTIAVFLRKRNFIHPSCPHHKNLHPLTLPPNLQRPQIPTRQFTNLRPGLIMVSFRLHHRPPSMSSDRLELEQTALRYMHQLETILLRERDIQSHH